MKQEDIHALESIEKLHNYNSYVFNKIFKKGLNQNTLDFGCGYGTLISYLKTKFNLEIIGYEINPEAIEKLNAKKINLINSLDENKERFDQVVSLNVLEHIENDQKTIEDINHLLKDNGMLVLYLPHSMKIWTDLDELVGHYRRYEIKDLKKKCDIVGLKIQSLHYADSIGFFASFAIKMFGYDKKKGIGSLSSLKFYDKWIFPISKLLDSIGLKYLFGKNLVLIATKN